MRRRKLTADVGKMSTYFIDGTIDDKNAILDFFTNTEKMEKVTTLLKFKGLRLFTLYQLHNKLESTNIFVISKYGVEFLNSNCYYMDDNELSNFLNKFFKRSCSDSNILLSLKKGIPFIIRHYNLYRDACYNLPNRDMKNICIIYPIDQELMRRLTFYLTSSQFKDHRKLFKGVLSSR